MKKLLLSLVIAFGFSACSLNNDQPSVDCGAVTELSFTGFPLLCNYAVKTNPNNPLAIVAGSEENMNNYFTKHENSCPNPSNPNIDFTQNVLVGIFAGLKPTSGYAIKITSIVENKCEILINYYEKAPLPGEEISQTATYPSDFILIPKSSKTILFNRTTETPDNVVIGSFNSKCVGPDCQKFYQLNDFNILKFQNVVAGSYDFSQYAYSVKTKRSEYTTFLTKVPAEILAIKGQTKTYGTPDSADQGGVYFELRQGSTVTKIYIDNHDTDDQSAEIKAFKKEIQDKINAQQ